MTEQFHFRSRPKHISIFWFIGVLSYFGGTLSLLLLTVEAFSIRSFYSPFERLMEYYSYLIDIALGWLDPILSGVYAGFGTLLGLDLALNPNWRHVLVLLLLYVASVTRVKLANSPNSPQAEYLMYASSVIFAVLASAVVGLVDFSDPHYFSQLLVCSVPAFFYWMNRPLRAAFSKDRKYFLKRLNIGIARSLTTAFAFAGILYALSRFDGISRSGHSIGLILLLTFMAIEAGRLITAGALGTDIRYRRPSLQDAPRIGRTMLSAFLGVVLFLALNAGFLAVGN